MTFAPHISQVVSDTAVAPLQRACDCGKSADALLGECPSCAQEKRLGSGPTLGAPGDAFEREADRVADQVMAASAVPNVQRMSEMEEEEEPLQMKPAASTPDLQLMSQEEEEEPLQMKPDMAAPQIQRMSETEEEEEQVQMKPAAQAPHAASATVQAAAAVATGGTPLPVAERAFFEPRFGRDLSAVRLHTGADAQAAARAIGARAFAHRHNIAFAPGQYAPGTPHGRHLLAHEITHTLQQGRGSVIRRTCPPGPMAPTDLSQFEPKVDAIKAHARYTALDKEDQGVADHIIDGARGSDCPIYYINRLWDLFETEPGDPDELAKETRENVAKSKKSKLPVNSKFEEDMADDPARKWQLRTGETGDKYFVDARDPTNVVVKLRVRAFKQGKGTDADVQNTKDLEDKIEKHASTKGFTLDIRFTNQASNTVFPVGVDPSEWTTSTNWAGDPHEIAHEAMHLLNLEDRYDYIKHQADNADLDIGDRLYWFREQMVRAPDPTGARSIMDDYDLQMDEIDVCGIVGGDFEDCLFKRFSMLTAAEIEAKAKPVNDQYRPEYGALLVVMRRAWSTRPFEEVTANCDTDDPLCGVAPPGNVFGSPDGTVVDANNHPLQNPHDQPEAKDALKRKERAP